MRKLLLIAVGFLLCLPLLGYSDNSAEYYDYSFARMSYVTGDVFIERAADMGYEQGIVNLPIVENDKLGTRDGRAEIHFGKKNYLRIDRYTHVDFTGLPRKGYDQIKLNLLSGNIYLRVSFLGREKDFEVHTPDASFYILEEGLYGIKVVENSETEIHVVEGSVEAAGEEGSVLVESEKRLVASNGVFLSSPEYLYASYSDNFFEWNNSRDAVHFRTVEKAYLPSELYEYESELASNGRWVYEASYGHVWVPHVYHHTWRPYHNGRWLWYPICGWTWVPYASWGWCVSHYGRWHWRFGLGWYWIPRCSWGPAWVHWHHGYNYVGWCPVSYWGYPVVVQNNYFYGRWNDRYYPVNSRALTVIHKNQLQAPRISKVSLSESQRNRLGKISLSAKQPGIKGTPQRNSLASQKASNVLTRSNIRKVGKSYSSNQALRSTSRFSTRTSTQIISGKSVNKSSSRAKDLASSQQKRARTAIKSYPSRTMSSTHSRSSVAKGRVSGSSTTYPSRTSSKESVKLGSRVQYQSRDSSSQKAGMKRSPSTRKTSTSIKMYPSRNSYSSRNSSKSNSNRYSSTARTSTKSTSSYRNPSRYSQPSRLNSSSERSRSSSSSYRSSPSYKSPSSSRSSSSYRSSPQSTSRGSLSSRSSSSSSRSSKSYTRSSRSSASKRSSSGKVSSTRSSSPSRSRTSSSSKSTKSVSKGSSKVRRK